MLLIVIKSSFAASTSCSGVLVLAQRIVTFNDTVTHEHDMQIGIKDDEV